MDSIDELIDELIKKCKKPEDLIGENGLLNQLSRETMEMPKQDPASTGQSDESERFKKLL